MTEQILTQDELKSQFHYCLNTGIFTNLKTSKKILSGNKDRYVHIRVKNKTYYAHRLALLYVYGKFPDKKMDTDHINHIKNDNSICNLKIATRSQNNQNKIKAKSENSTGLLGAYFHKQIGKYTSRIMVNKKDKYLGVFDTALEAHYAYLIAKRELHGFSTL